MNKTLNLEDCVTSEIAQKLKEKGYPLLRVIKQRGEPIIYDLPQNHPNWQNCNAYYIPTISQVLKWLRGKDIMVEIPPVLCDDGTWLFSFRVQTKELYDRSMNDYTSYESASLACIEHVLDKLI